MLITLLVLGKVPLPVVLCCVVLSCVLTYTVNGIYVTVCVSEVIQTCVTDCLGFVPSNGM
jgi:hypothetical protein